MLAVSGELQHEGQKGWLLLCLGKVSSTTVILLIEPEPNQYAGMSDYYRDRVRHGGILSNDFICELN